jgi:glycosyltransferase involved in cell wall biosynthesis
LTLELHVDRPPPAAMPAGTADAFFCTGTIADRVDRLEIIVDGARTYPAMAYGMPPDGLFWAIVPVRAGSAPGEVVIEARAWHRDGTSSSVVIGRVAIESCAQPPAAPQSDLIAVCMATYEPDPALLATQIESLRAQTDGRWICLISDDGSSEKAFAGLTELVRDDPRFELSRSPERRGFYRNFERALRMAPADVELVALCDQDDRWHPDKLAALRAGIGSATLVYSDMRLVEADGTLLRDTLWRGRRNNHENLTSMLVANTITGAAALFRRELLELLLPFPDTPGFQFHDAWLAVAALASGDVAYIDRPLYDYVQHPAAVFGDVTHGKRQRRSTVRPAGPRAWRASYFHGYLSRATQAEVVLARRGDELASAKRKALERFVACDRSAVELAGFAGRSLRPLAGRTETLGSEFGLAAGVAWKHLATALVRRGVSAGPLTDATIPGPERFTQRRLRRWRAAV